MSMDDLVGVIETLQERIRVHGKSLQENEIRTRMALIDPLLQALGWDPSDPTLVTPEYNVSGGKADYALLRHDGKPAATVEAKKLGESLDSDSHLMQMLNYANASGVKYAGLTNGNRWELYDVFKPVPLEDKRILNVSIADTQAHKCALALLLLWRPNVASGQTAPANAPILAAPTPDPTPPEPVVSQPEPTIVVPANSVSLEAGWVALANFSASTGTNPPPSEVRFPDDSRRKITTWRQIVDCTVEWLWTRDLLTLSNVPVASSKKRYIVNVEPRHQEGNNFGKASPITGTKLFVEGNISSLAAVANAKKLVEHCGKDLAEVWLKID